MNKLTKNTILYSIGEIFPKMISFFLLPIYTQYLSTSDYGILSYTNSVVIFLFVLSSLSLNSFVLRYYFIRKTEMEKRMLMGNIFLFLICSNLILTILAFLILPPCIQTFNMQIPWNPYFRLAIINNFLEVFAIIPFVLYRVKQNALKFITLSLSRTVIQIALTLFFIVYMGYGLLGYYYAALYTLIPFSLIYIFIVYKNAIINFCFKEIKEGLKFSLPLLPGALSYLILSFFDRIILERYVDLKQIGIYNVAFTLALSLNIVIQSGYKALEPEVFKRYGSLNYETFIMKIQSVFLFFVYSGAMCLTLFSQEIVLFMTSEGFHKAYLLIPILMVGVIMTGQNVIYNGILSADRKTKVIGIATLIGAVFSLVFNFLLIPRAGIYAAALSYAVSFSIMNAILYFNIKIPIGGINKSIISVVLFALTTIFLFYFIKIEVSITGVLLKVGLLIAYMLALCKIWNISPSIVKQIIKREV